MPFTNIPTHSKVLIEYEEQGSVCLAFDVEGGKNIPVGAGVQLTSTGTVDTLTSGENFIGVVVVPKNADGKVVVKTNFLAVGTAIAKSAITLGALLKEVGADSITNKRITLEPAAATNYAQYRALSAQASAGGEVYFAVLPSPVVKS